MNGEMILAIAYGTVMILAAGIVWRAVVAFYDGDD